MTTTGQKNTDDCWTKEELSQYFHMTMRQASVELNVGETTLKKICRQVGFNRWPYRKLKSLDDLIDFIKVSPFPFFF